MFVQVNHVPPAIKNDEGFNLFDICTGTDQKSIIDTIVIRRENIGYVDINVALHKDGHGIQIRTTLRIGNRNCICCRNDRFYELRQTCRAIWIKQSGPGNTCQGIIWPTEPRATISSFATSILYRIFPNAGNEME